MNTLRLITIFLIIFLAFSAGKLSNNLESKDEIIELQKEKLRLKIDLFNKYDKSLNQRYKTADSIRVIRDSLNVVLSKLINRNNYLINKIKDDFYKFYIGLIVHEKDINGYEVHSYTGLIEKEVALLYALNGYFTAWTRYYKAS